MSAIGAIGPAATNVIRQATTVAAPFFQGAPEVAKVASKSFLSSTPGVGQIFSAIA